MEEYKASFQFIDYIVNKAEYNMNSNFKPSEEASLEVDFDIEAIISFEDDADDLSTPSADSNSDFEGDEGDDEDSSQGMISKKEENRKKAYAQGMVQILKSKKEKAGK